MIKVEMIAGALAVTFGLVMTIIQLVDRQYHVAFAYGWIVLTGALYFDAALRRFRIERTLKEIRKQLNLTLENEQNEYR